MSKLQEYINENYEGKSNWFEEEVKTTWQMDRINESLDIMEYLDGKHKILKRNNTVWKGKQFKTRKIILQICKPILTFQKSFLLKNPLTLTSDDEETLKQYKEVYKKGKYNNIDDKILDGLLKYGEIFEYIHFDNDRKIKSSIIKSVDSYPVINRKGEYIAFIEHYISSGISYYTIYTENKVEEYNNKGNELHRTGQYINISGLPIRYILPSETDEYKGRSDMKDWINLIDEMEDLLSKYADSFYKLGLNPLPILTGTKLSTGKDGQGAIDPTLVGQVLQLEHMSTFDYKTAKMDYQSFKEEYKILEKNLLNISMTPSISMSGLEIANVSTDSIKIMFYMAIAKANMTAKHLYEGFDNRWKVMKSMIERVGGQEYEGYISGVFKFDIPSNDSEIVDNLVKLDKRGKISTEQLLSLSPYCYDVTSELERLMKEVDREDKEGATVKEDKQVG